jgi:bacterioferritin
MHMRVTPISHKNARDALTSVHSFADNRRGGLHERYIMKGDKQVIAFLNSVLKNELTSINQYFLHSRILKQWGMNRLAAAEYKESIDEMKHADALTQRILFLEGLPNMQDLGKLMIGQDVKEILTADLGLENAAIPILKEGIAHCEKVADYISRELFEKILESEEEHVDWLETQLDMVERMGMQNYVQLERGYSAA